MVCESEDDFLMGGMEDGSGRSMLAVGAVGGEATPCEEAVPCPNLSKLRRSVFRVELLASGAGVFKVDVFGL
jgi:hypothetical protein